MKTKSTINFPKNVGVEFISTLNHLYHRAESRSAPTNKYTSLSYKSTNFTLSLSLPVGRQGRAKILIQKKTLSITPPTSNSNPKYLHFSNQKNHTKINYMHPSYTIISKNAIFTNHYQSIHYKHSSATATHFCYNQSPICCNHYSLFAPFFTPKTI